jgi:selT/selW/selH-like putative selenoprotein
MSAVNLHIEYCTEWKYDPQYESLRALVLQSVPQATVTGAVGPSTSFEITLNGKLIYSKLQTKKLPDEQQILIQVQQAAEAK